MIGGPVFVRFASFGRARRSFGFALPSPPPSARPTRSKAGRTAAGAGWNWAWVPPTPATVAGARQRLRPPSARWKRIAVVRAGPAPSLPARWPAGGSACPGRGLRRDRRPRARRRGRVERCPAAPARGRPDCPCRRRSALGSSLAVGLPPRSPLPSPPDGAGSGSGAGVGSSGWAAPPARRDPAGPTCRRRRPLPLPCSFPLPFPLPLPCRPCRSRRLRLRFALTPFRRCPRSFLASALAIGPGALPASSTRAIVQKTAMPPGRGLRTPASHNAGGGRGPRVLLGSIRLQLEGFLTPVSNFRPVRAATA